VSHKRRLHYQQRSYEKRIARDKQKQSSKNKRKRKKKD